jgi:spermidine synthase
MGQHLLVDFEHVDAEFLASEERLALAMVQLVEKSSLTMLSYHCHSYERIGVSCVGVLLESHVAIHSFPAFGILALDLFTCGRNNPLFPLIPYIEQLFGLPTKSQDAEPPRMVWSHKRRGFSLADEERNLADIDYHQVLGYTDFNKVHVLDEATAYQAVQIVDVHDDSRATSDRILYLDGVLQSRKHGEAAYHEALVHSAMFVHPDPKRVVIIGGGEGATLREVLKHNTVEEVVMIEIDERLVEIAQEHLEEWNDCSSLLGSASSCFADPRVTLVFSDAVAWFMNRFGNGSASSVAPFDVIIMDAL